MKNSEAIYYVGFMIGAIVGHYVMRHLEIGGIIGILGTFAFGMGLGFMAERAFVQTPGK